MYATLVLLNLFQPCHDAARDARWAAAQMYCRCGDIVEQNEKGLKRAEKYRREGKTKWDDGTDLNDKIAAFHGEIVSWGDACCLQYQTMTLLDDAFPPTVEDRVHEAPRAQALALARARAKDKAQDKP